MIIPKPVLDFISQKIELENYCLPHFYPTPETFEKFQIGYRTNGNTGLDITGEKTGDFKSNWYVICSGYADDPFFIDISESAQNYPVYFAWHGAGDWTPLKVAESIRTFSANLKVVQEIEANSTNKQDELAKHFDIDDEFWREVYDEYEEFED